MKIHNLILAIFFLLMLAGNVDAASFDCGKAATEIEKLICGDDELSRLDESLHKAYLQALQRTDMRRQTIESQRQWLKSERNVCQNAECIKRAYEIRISELGLSSSHGIAFPRPANGNASPPKALPEESKSQSTEPRGTAIQTEPGQEHESIDGSVDDTAVFYLDGSNPVVRLDRLPNAFEGVKAILAAYALENGAGCDYRIAQGLRCALTRELGLGANCSDAHIGFVRSWFKVMPKLTSRLVHGLDDDSQKPGSLENLCYGKSDMAGVQNLWEIIRVSVSKETVAVDAILHWGSRWGHGRVRYRNTYRIEQHTVTEVSSRITDLEYSQESIFKGGE